MAAACPAIWIQRIAREPVLPEDDRDLLGRHRVEEADALLRALPVSVTTFVGAWWCSPRHRHLRKARRRSKWWVRRDRRQYDREFAGSRTCDRAL